MTRRAGAGLRVGLFITCVNDTVFPETGRATVTLLERLGCEVVFPEEQTCCGQVHANAGYPDEALILVRRFVRVFREAGVDAIVTPSGSCAAMVHEQYPRLVAGESGLAAAVAALRVKTFELSQFLVEGLASRTSARATPTA